MESFVTSVALIGVVIVIASLLSGVIERSGFPLTPVFLLLGAAIGPWGFGIADVGFHSPALHVLAMLGLALLLFSDAVTLDTKQLRTRARMVWRLIGPGTLVPAFVTALTAWLLLDLSKPAAAILGAALASTDPVLLRSVLRSKALPDAARIALRLETGMNDVTLLPIVIISMLLMPGGHVDVSTSATSGSNIGRSLLGLFVLGPALGALVGYVGISLLALVRTRFGVRRDYESLYALGLAFTSFSIAEAVGGSGFVAAFVAGLLVAARDIELCDCFLEYGEATAEMLLLLTFVALGTTLIWQGLSSVDWRIMLFAVIAIVARPVALYPMLKGLNLHTRDRRLIAAFGPRGLSSLLLALLPVFAGIPNAEQIFTITAVVVLLSVVVHGGGTAIFLRSSGLLGSPGPAGVLAPLNRAAAVAQPVSAQVTTTAEPAQLKPGQSAEEPAPIRITIDEMRPLQAKGEPVVIVDARSNRTYDSDPLKAVGAVRINPEDPVRDATEKRLSQRATLVVYCA
ncbi:MAG TPA: cation:proton antiporter [Gemmatimonadaceae bacterium]|nr:cation:proton antiporter [Gemmatimonadaceae bacterium]